MKNLNYIIFSSLCILLCHPLAKAQNEKGYEINGKVIGIKDGTKVFLKRNAETGGGIDTLAITEAKNERFQFKGNLKLVGDYYFITIDSIGSKKSSGPIFMDNSKMSLLASEKKWPNDVTIKGSDATQQYNQLTQTLRPISKKIDSLEKMYNRLKTDLHSKTLNRNSDTANDISKLNNLDMEMKLVVQHYKNKWIDFINANPNSLYTAYSILKGGDFLTTLKERQESYDKLTERVKASFYGVKLKKSFENKKRAKNISVGMSAPDFVSITPEGKSLSLKEVIAESKLTLVDFWGSWCKPCRAAIPNIKKVYNEFHDKGFNILGVAAEYSAGAWKKALEEEQMPWYQVSQLKGRNEDAYVIYDLNAVPAYLLIDEKGKIVAIDLPASSNLSAGGKLHGNDLYRKVEEILGRGK
ncbi:TlpA disulfide reductase family protein [Pedobacter ginsengisoli]|uniref:TlpA disulfide reductase family protein n=1 Tax=Pedobacter ginsengisoli TaxID=363852 RepID=UPI00254F645B|nr:TlpA disulfide reductase family protein [Pedobacter ginsengisoli]